MRSLKYGTLLVLMLTQGCATHIDPVSTALTAEEIVMQEKWDARPQLKPYQREGLDRALTEFQEPLILTNSLPE